MSEEKSQEFLYNLCQTITLKNEIVSQDDKREKVINCWIETFKEYAIAKNITFPVPKDQFYTILADSMDPDKVAAVNLSIPQGYNKKFLL